MYVAGACWIDSGDGVCFDDGMENDELGGWGSNTAAGTLLSGLYNELHIELRDADWRYGWVYVRGQFGGREFECERDYRRDFTGYGDLPGGYLRDDECAELGD